MNSTESAMTQTTQLTAERDLCAKRAELTRREVFAGGAAVLVASAIPHAAVSGPRIIHLERIAFDSNQGKAYGHHHHQAQVKSLAGNVRFGLCFGTDFECR